MGFIALLLLCTLLALPVAADTVTTDPVAVQAGTFELAAQVVSLSGQVVSLCWTPNPWPADGRVMEYLWEESDDGATWHAWTGGRITGGPKINKAGQAITCFGGSSTSRFTGTVYIRLTGTYTNGAAITLATTITY
jgi:hypothetical protein